jgi:UDP-N-acetylglucosamine 1-carboxyvinyltransferase
MSGLFIPDYLEINGGGKLKPDARLDISGAKNEVLGAMAAAVLTDRPMVLRNVPHISDVLDMGRILISIGADVRYDADKKRMRIHVARLSSNVLSDEAYKFRASYYIWGALMARFAITGEFDRLVIKIPGGCSFGGRRAINYHLDLMRNVFGATIRHNDAGLELALPKSSAKNGAPIYSTIQASHGATFHWLLSAATSAPTKMMYNASLEPEVPHLLGILNKMGAKFRGTGATGIISTGRGELLNGIEADIMPDRLETASYALLAMGLRCGIKLSGTDARSCRPWLNSVLEIAGGQSARIAPDGASMAFDFSELGSFPGQRFLMSPIPGKETDLHQIWAPILAGASSGSEIYDPIWPGRRGHLPELEKFGLVSSSDNFKIKNSVAGNALRIRIEPSALHASSSSGMDLRGAFGLIVAAAIARGRSVISTPQYALRGYPNMIENLRNLGVDITPSGTGLTIQPLPQI